MLANSAVLFGPELICDMLLHTTYRKTIFRFLALSIGVMLMAFSAHKFYVSKTTLEVNPRTNETEITMKIFTDDLDRALGQDEKSRNYNLLPDYVYKHFWLKFNNQPLALSYVGNEIENDITYVYFSIQPAGSANTWEVHNSLLVDAIPEQQNMFDLRWNGNTKTLILTKDHTTELVMY
jgi:hypothetical protein